MEKFRQRFPGRTEMIAFCNQKNIPVKASVSKPYSSDENCLHVSYEAGKLEDLKISGIATVVVTGSVVVVTGATVVVVGAGVLVVVVGAAATDSVCMLSSVLPHPASSRPATVTTPIDVTRRTFTQLPPKTRVSLYRPVTCGP